MAAQWLPRLVFIALTVTSSLSFVLRRRDWDDDADSGLAQALPVLREERRRLEERPLGGDSESFWDEPDLRDDENPDQPLELSPRLREDEEKEEEEAEEAARQDLLGSFLENVDPNYMEEVLGSELPEDEDSEREEIESPANMDELENILGPSEEEKEQSLKEKKNIPYQLGGPGSSKTGKRDIDSSDIGSFLERKAEDVEQEALANSNIVEDDEEEKYNEITPLPVSKEDIEQILKDDDNDDINDLAEEYSISERSNDDNQKEIIPPLNYAPIVPLKIKRSSSFQFERELEKDQEEGQLAREYIRRFLELEDDENTNLANALNLATMAQVKHSDKLIIPEAKFIKKAIEDEEAIQELKASLNGGIQEPAMAAEAIGKREIELSPLELVQEAEKEEEENQREDDEDNMIEPEFDTEETDEELEDVPGESELASRLREYLVKAGSQLGMDVDENEIQTDGPETAGPWFDEEPNAIEDDDIEAEQDWELNPLLRELYRRYQGGRYSKRGDLEIDNMIPDEEEESEFPEDDFEDVVEDEPSEGRIAVLEEEIENALENFILERQEEAEREIEEEEEEEEEGGMCPALELVDGCSYAVHNLGLKLDAEALDLCNRHQLCYACGAAHGMASSDCDNGYLIEANRLCEAQGDDEDCSTDAAGLFVVMLESHRFRQREVPEVCSEKCTIDYIIGLATK